MTISMPLFFKDLFSAFRAPLLLLLGALLPLAAPAQTPADARGLPTLAPLVNQVTPAVVNISVVTRAPVEDNPLFRDPFFRRFFNLPDKQQRQEQSAGSGVIVDAARGFILTNNHVIKDAEQVIVTLKDRRQFPAKLVGTDPGTDIAVLQINALNLSALRFGDSDMLQVGDYVLAIGNPFGIGQTVTSGIVSALGRSGLSVEGYEDFIQTDASINPGNSGGALVSLDGRLIGINTAIYSQSGGSVGIGFATPSNIVERMVSTGTQGGRIVRPWLGVSMQRVTPDLAAGFGLARPAGLIVKEVFPGGPGAAAGLKRNDVIIGIREQVIDDEAGLRFRLSTLNTDVTVPVRVMRSGKEVVVNVKLAAPPENPPRDKAQLDGRQPLSGATVVNMSPAVAEEMGLAEWRAGVVVLEVKPGAYAGRFVRQGDMILGINGQDVKNVDDLKKRLGGQVSSVSIGRDGMVSTVQFR